MPNENIGQAKEDGFDRPESPSLLGPKPDDEQKLLYNSFEMSEEAKNCGCEATALIVDDNAFNLIPLEVILQGLGIVSEQALGGQEAID